MIKQLQSRFHLAHKQNLEQSESECSSPFLIFSHITASILRQYWNILKRNTFMIKGKQCLVLVAKKTTALTGFYLTHIVMKRVVTGQISKQRLGFFFGSFMLQLANTHLPCAEHLIHPSTLNHCLILITVAGLPEPITARGGKTP